MNKNNWPDNHAARILTDGWWLRKGMIANVIEATPTRLKLTASDLEMPYVLVERNRAIPVPNFLPASPDELAEALDADQCLVGDLLNDGYSFFRLPGTGRGKAVWEEFLEMNLGTDPLVVLRKYGEAVYLTDAEPTTVSVATKVAD